MNFSFNGLRWNLDREDFIKDIPLINELKLRLGWGQIGNHGIGAMELYQIMALTKCFICTWERYKRTTYFKQYIQPFIKMGDF